MIKLDLNTEELKRKYLATRSINKIGREMGHSANSISKYLKLVGVQLRKGTDKKISVDVQEATRLYINESMSVEKIAKKFNVSFSVIYNRLKENNVKMRKCTEVTDVEARRNASRGNTSRRKKRVWNRQAEIMDLYEKGNSVYKIASKFMCSRTCIENILKRKGVKFKGASFFNAGEKAYNWQGGKSFEPYSLSFNKIFKQKIRERDNFVCLKCNLFEEDNKKLYDRVLAVHHIDYDKKLTIQENCCALCVRCNGEVNFNRPHWTKFFQSMLSERYGYQYNEENEPIIELEKVEVQNAV